MTRARPLWLTVTAATLAVLVRIKESGRMNRYGRQAMRHWQRHLPTAYRSLEDPTVFFTRAGEEIQTQVSELAARLAGPDLQGEDYRDKVARLNRATAEAEQIVLADSGMFPEPEQTREEWLQSTPQEDALIDWAWRMQAQLEGLAETSLDFDQAAEQWMLPRAFLEEMARASSPWKFWKSHPTQWETSVQARWDRDQQGDGTDHQQ